MDSRSDGMPDLAKQVQAGADTVAAEAGAAPETELVEPMPVPMREAHTAWSLSDETAPNQPRRGEVIRTIAAAVGSVALGAGVTFGVMQMTAKPASPSVVPAPVTVTNSPAAALSPDERFIVEIGHHGVYEEGSAAAGHYYEQDAHWACYNLLPPEPQPIDWVIRQVVADQNKTVDNGGHMPKLTHEQGESLVRAAVAIYCPSAPNI